MSTTCSRARSAPIRCCLSWRPGLCSPGASPDGMDSTGGCFPGWALRGSQAGWCATRVAARRHRQPVDNPVLPTLLGGSLDYPAGRGGQLTHSGLFKVGADGMKVLVVDDDPRLREALEVGLQLQWEDAQVISAADGETGLDLFFQQEPDVVL